MQKIFGLFKIKEVKKKKVCSINIYTVQYDNVHCFIVLYSINRLFILTKLYFIFSK